MKSTIFTRDILLLLAAAFFYSSSPMLMAPLIAGFSESLGMHAALAGTMTGIMYLSSLFCRPLFGRLADLHSKSTLMKLGLVIIAISVLMTALAFHGWVILIARLLNGAGYCMCSISLTTWIASLLPRNKVSTGMGCYGMINAIANALAPMLTLQLSSHFSDRVSFLVSFVSVVIALVLVCLVKKQKQPDFKDQPAPARELFSRRALPFAGIMMCFTVPFYATTSFLVEYTATRGWPASPSVYFLVYSIALLCMRMVLKDYFDKWPFRLFYWGSFISGLAACVFLDLGSSSWMYALAGIGMAGGYGIMCSECQSASILAVEPALSGLASSTFYIGIDAGLLLGPIIGGAIIEQLGVAWVYPITGAILAASLLIYFPVRKRIGAIH